MKEQRSLRGKVWQTTHTGLQTDVLQAAVLKARMGQAEATLWLEPSFKDLADPFALRGMQTAKERVELAIARQERIMVYGDFDADGITSTVALVHGLKRLGADVSYRIPERVKHSHGLKKDLIDEIVATGSKLIITVDCGVNDREEVAYAVEKGLEVIITDHHHVDPDRVVDKAVAIVNPSQSGCEYPTQNLAGVGVVFKLLQALNSNETWLQPYLSLVAIGSVADCVHLSAESRTLVQLGLKALNQNHWPCLGTLLEHPDFVDAETIGFQLAPCLNAASRLGEVKHAVQLFLGAENQTGDRVAYLKQLNEQRRLATKQFTAQAEKLVNKNNAVQVLLLPDCPVGILGLVASRLVETLAQPICCLTVHENGELHGSARGPKEGNLIEGLTNVSQYLSAFGGHSGAAGFRLSEGDLAEFIEGLNKWYAAHPSLTPTLSVEGDVLPADLDFDWLNWQNQMQPFGIGNPSPVWQLPDLKLTDIKMMGREGIHARLTFENKYEVVAFFVSDILDQLKVGEGYRLAVKLGENTWNGETSVQWQLVDVRD